MFTQQSEVTQIYYLADDPVDVGFRDHESTSPHSKGESMKKAVKEYLDLQFLTPVMVSWVVDEPQRS